MKQLLRFPAMLFVMVSPFLFVSCGDNKSEKSDKPAEDKAASVNTIVTTPEMMVTIRHKVKDYAAWKAVYDGHDSARRAAGLYNFVIGRGTDDSMMVMVALKADNLDKAKAFAGDPGLKAAMQKGGVSGEPWIRFSEILWQDTASVGSIPRVLSTYSVKDWATWLKVFESGKADRVANGLLDRNYGHEAGDNTKISTVLAITDLEKAKAHWGSDALKKTREEAGLTSDPERFIFNIVQRY